MPQEVTKIAQATRQPRMGARRLPIGAEVFTDAGVHMAY